MKYQIPKFRFSTLKRDTKTKHGLTKEEIPWPENVFFFEFQTNIFFIKVFIELLEQKDCGNQEKMRQ